MAEKKKKPSFFLVLLRLILILLLLALLAAAGFAWWLCDSMKKTAVTLDDIPACIAAEPMDAGERLRFDESGGMVTVLDKNDVWWMIDKLYGMDWAQDAADAAASYHVEYDGVGLRLEDGEAWLDAQGHWKSIVLRASVPLEVTCEDGTIRAVPAGLYVGGRAVPLSLIERFVPLDLDSLSVSYTPETAFTDRVESAVLSGGKLLLSGPLSADVFRELPDLPRFQYLRWRLFMDGYGDALEAKRLYEEDPALAYSAVLPRLTADPGAFCDFEYGVLALMDADAFDDLKLESLNYGFIDRWFPRISDVPDEHAALDERYRVRQDLLKEFQDALEDAYCAGEITVREGQYMCAGQPFTMEAFFGEAWEEYRVLFDSEPILCAMAVPGYSDKYAPALAKIADGPESFDRDVDMQRQTPLGVLVTGRDGTPYLLSRSISNSLVAGLGVVETINYNILSVLPETFAEAQATEKVPVVRE